MCSFPISISTPTAANRTTTRWWKRYPWRNRRPAPKPMTSPLPQRERDKRTNTAEGPCPPPTKRENNRHRRPPKDAQPLDDCRSGDPDANRPRRRLWTERLRPSAHGSVRLESIRSDPGLYPGYSLSRFRDHPG